MNITIQYHERQIGPYTLEEVNRRLRDGKIKPDALAWQEGTEGWVPLKSIPGIGASATPVPRVVSVAIKKKFYQRPLAWCAVILVALLALDIAIRLRSQGSQSTPEQSSLSEAERAEKVRLGKSAKAPTPEQLSKAVRVRARVLQVTEDGLLVIAKEDAPTFAVGNSTGNGGGVFIPSGREDKNGYGRPREIYGNFFLSGHPKHKSLADDAEIDVDAYQDGIATYSTALGARRTVKSYRVIKAFE